MMETIKEYDPARSFPLGFGGRRGAGECRLGISEMVSSVRRIVNEHVGITQCYAYSSEMGCAPGSVDRPGVGTVPDRRRAG